MTNRERVLAKWPKARDLCYKHGSWAILKYGMPNMECLGSGTSQHAAWSDAASRLPAK